MTAPSRAGVDVRGVPANCADVLRHLWDYLDDEMSPLRTEQLRTHIASCSWCRELQLFQRGFLGRLARLKRHLTCPGAVRAKLAEKLRAEGCRCDIEDCEQK